MSPELQERCRQYGLARIVAASECRTAEDWQTKWQPTRHPFAFQWGDCWKAVVELKVADFPAEVGFFIDVLGFDVNAFSAAYAMLMTPEKEYTLLSPRHSDQALGLRGAGRLTPDRQASRRSTRPGPCKSILV